MRKLRLEFLRDVAGRLLARTAFKVASNYPDDDSATSSLTPIVEAVYSYYTNPDGSAKNGDWIQAIEHRKYVSGAPVTLEKVTYCNDVSALTGTSTDAVDGNPYFWAAVITPNEWHLLVGYVHPAGYLGTISYSRGFNSAGQVVANGTDFRWRPTTSGTLQRAYLYYCEEADVQQEFFNPRVEAVSSVFDPIDVLLTAKPNAINPSTWVLDSQGTQPGFTHNR